MVAKAGRMITETTRRGAEVKDEEERRAGFVEAVNRICLAAGGVRVDGPVTTWEIDTRAGRLQVCPIDNANAPWIACRFLEPERVEVLFR